MAILTHGNYNCACSREVCDWTCTTYATMMSDLVPNTASQPFKNLSKPFKSNADRIRAMSDEELANWLSLHIYVRINALPRFSCGTEPLRDKWLDWLRQEASK